MPNMGQWLVYDIVGKNSVLLKAKESPNDCYESNTF